MKRNIFLILILCISILLPACNNLVKTTDTGTEYNSDIPSEENTNNSNNNECIIEDRMFIIYSLSEYNKVFKDIEVPDDFISYDMLSELGEFSSFTSYSLELSFDHYGYGIIDTKGHTMIIHVLKKNGENSSSTLNTLTSSTADLRYNPNTNKDYGAVNNNHMKYVYFGGALKNIQWENSNWKYIITLTSGHGSTLATYPETNETILGRLLNAETAAEAQNELIAMVSK